MSKNEKGHYVNHCTEHMEALTTLCLFVMVEIERMGRDMSPPAGIFSTIHEHYRRGRGAGNI
jgi:hypothetical protein